MRAAAAAALSVLPPLLTWARVLTALSSESGSANVSDKAEVEAANDAADAFDAGSADACTAAATAAGTGCGTCFF